MAARPPAVRFSENDPFILESALSCRSRFGRFGICYYFVRFGRDHSEPLIETNPASFGAWDAVRALACHPRQALWLCELLWEPFVEQFLFRLLQIMKKYRILRKNWDI